MEKNAMPQGASIIKYPRHVAQQHRTLEALSGLRVGFRIGILVNHFNHTAASFIRQPLPHSPAAPYAKQSQFPFGQVDILLSCSLLVEHKVHNPTTSGVWAFSPAMRQDVLIVASRFLQRISQDGHVFEPTFLVDGSRHLHYCRGASVFRQFESRSKGVPKNATDKRA
jgi:hypothetical protein